MTRSVIVFSFFIGSEYESVVSAVDQMNHTSKTAKSNGVVVDTTQPKPASMEQLEHNIALNPSFENSGNIPSNWDHIKNISLCRGSSNALPISWNSSVGSCVNVLKSGKNIAMDGRAFLFLKGEISQILNFLNVNKLYRITFVTAHPPLLGAVLANKEGYVEFGGQRHVFMVYTKQDKHDVLSTNVDWHHHTFYFWSYRPEGIVKLGSMTGNTGILFDDLKVQETELHNDSSASGNSKHVYAHVVSMHQWSSVHASWSFIDPESPIVDYMWAIGKLILSLTAMK